MILLEKTTLFSGPIQNFFSLFEEDIELVDKAFLIGNPEFLDELYFCR